MSPPKPVTQARRIPIGTRSVTGRHQFNGVPYESSLERDFLTICAFDYRVADVQSQPLKVSYIDHAGRQRKYTPDFLVHYRRYPPKTACHPHTLCEIKPKAKLLENESQFELKFEAARRYAESQDWQFQVLTEDDIRTPFLANARFLLPYRNVTFDPEIAEMLLHQIGALGKTDPQTLISSLFEDRVHQAEYLPTLWHLIATYQIGTDFDQPLTMKSRIWRNS